MKEEMYFTLSGTQYYYGTDPLQIGSLFYCEKEPENKHDLEAIRAMLPIAGPIGYVANSSHTVAHGTFSAGRLFDKMPECFYGRVLFKVDKFVICRVETEHPDLLQMELTSQLIHIPETREMKRTDSVIKKPQRR